MESLYKIMPGERTVWKAEGFTPPAGSFLHGEWTSLGTITGGEKDDPWQIRVCVNAMPARFWRFEVTPNSEPGLCPLTFETGSGRLDEYLPTAKLMAAGMIVMK